MIYYITVISGGTALTSNLGQLAHDCISYHTNLGKTSPSILNEPCMFMAIDNKAKLKQIQPKETDIIRLSLKYEYSGYNNRVFNIDHFIQIKEIYDEMKALKFNVDPKVVYV